MEISPNLSEGAIGELAGLSWPEGARRFPDDFRTGRTVVARLAAARRTAPGGETHEAFLARAADAARRLRSELAVDDDPLLVVSHGGLLNYALQYLMEVPVRDEVPFGFDHCGVVRLVSHREAPDFGPFPMLRFSSM